MISFEIYTKKDCVPCQAAKEKLKAYQIEYKEYIIGQDITREQLLQKFPYAKITPVIVHLKSGTLIDLPMLEIVMIADQLMKGQANDIGPTKV